MPGIDQQKEAQQKLLKEIEEGKRTSPFQNIPMYDPLQRFKEIVNGGRKPIIGKKE